jgi:alpha-L-rhamnosidase
VTTEGNVRFADFYDGETYDATIDLHKAPWKRADVMRLLFAPRITARIGCPVEAHERMAPIRQFTAPDGEAVYDFEQNFAGVIALEIGRAHV